MTAVSAARARALSLLDRVAWIGPLLARLVIGSVFVTSGWGKLHDIPKVVDYFTELGIPAPAIQAPFVAGVEFACGLAVLVGFLTRLAALPLIGTMTVALLTALRAQVGSFDDLAGIPEFLYIVILVLLITHGAGALSVDRLLFRRPPPAG
jgi:putative oxidoreductase